MPLTILAFSKQAKIDPTKPPAAPTPDSRDNLLKRSSV